MADDTNQDDHNEEEEFNPIGTIWLLVGYLILIIAFWGYAYLEMVLGS